MIILGIETSCDECAAAVVERGNSVLSSVVSSQIALHAPFGGIVPEVASRSHLETVYPVIEEALRQGGLKPADLDAIAVTHRPGLIGSLLVGLNAAKGLALARGLPLIAVNHVEAHVYASVMDAESPPYPLVALVASGGHTSLYLVSSVLDLELIGRTLDDAAGEAFDKVAAVLQLEYPGGPAIEKAAAQAGCERFSLPRPLPGSRESLDFSFSGLKTAVLYRHRGLFKKKGRTASGIEPVYRPDDRRSRAALAASFQEAVVEVLTKRLFQAAERHGARAVAAGGGVASNSLLRSRLREEAAERGLPLFIAPLSLTTDNGAMIAGLAYHIHCAGRHFDLDVDARAN